MTRQLIIYLLFQCGGESWVLFLAVFFILNRRLTVVSSWHCAGPKKRKEEVGQQQPSRSTVNGLLLRMGSTVNLYFSYCIDRWSGSWTFFSSVGFLCPTSSICQQPVSSFFINKKDKETGDRCLETRHLWADTNQRTSYVEISYRLGVSVSICLVIHPSFPSSFFFL